MKGGVGGSELCPFFEQFRPQLEVVSSELFDGCAVAELRRKVAVIIAHEAHADSKKAPGHAEVGMLLVGSATTVILFQLNRSMLA